MSQPSNAKHCCFSGLLHTLLCDGNGNFSDQIIESYETQKVHPKNKSAMANAASTPGVIARLMGLDSMPSNSNLEFKKTIPDSEFVDYMLEFDNASQSNHRRAKISASFREVSELFRHKNRREVLVLCWDSGRGDSNDEKKSRKFCKLKNEPRIVKNGCSSKIEELFELKQMKNMRKQWSLKKIESEYSPVSILDINDYKYLYGPDFLEKKLLADEIEDRAMKNKGYFSELEMKICNLIENDMKELHFTQKGICETKRRNLDSRIGHDSSIARPVYKILEPCFHAFSGEC
ncbi:hypothetical protein AHAS_Ahas04G0155900 [Arachis hypogaea]